MLKPLHDRVVVKRTAAEEKTPGGIYIPEGAAEKPEEGEVLAVGPGAYQVGVRITPTVKVGDRVVFEKYQGHVVKLNGEELLVMKEEHIIGVLDFTAIG